NGEVVHRATGESAVRTDYAPFTIGLNSGSRYCKGDFKDIRLWDVARTQEELKENMAGLRDVNNPQLIGYWKLDEGEGGVAYDSSPHQRHGTINGSAPRISTLDV